MSLVGHSMGAIVCFLYASSFPSECDMVIAIDALVPIPKHNFLLLDSYQNGLHEILISDERNMTGSEPPSYSYETAVQRLLTGTFNSYTKESLPYLLLRGMKESKSNPNNYFFIRDSRIKSRVHFFVQEEEMYVEMATKITAPYCYIKALQCGFNFQWNFMDEMLQTMKNSNPLFELHGVDGDHHVHLTEPEKVSLIVSRFVDMHRPVNIFSKL